MRAYVFAAAVIGTILIYPAGVLRGEGTNETEGGRITRLIQQLGDDDFAKREGASKELGAIGEPALAALRKAAASSDDIEIRVRAEMIVREIAARRLAIAARKEIEGLQGTWHSMSTEIDGVRQSGENKADRHFFSGDQWTCKDGETVVQTATVKIVEASGELVKIDFLITDGSRKGETWVGLYQRGGDELKWCGGYIGEVKARPTTVATKPGDGYFLRSLRREKK
jgi:uncharacterized protein (TIGR03067 family)